MAEKKIILQGGGEHARVVLDALLSDKSEVLALFDPKYNGHLFGIPQLGKYDPGFETDALVIVAIGNNKIRKEVAAKTKHNFARLIHSTAIVSPFAEIGNGSMVLHGVIIQAQTRIGNHVIVNTGARVDHDCLIDNYVHLAPGCVLCGTVQVGEGTLVGAGSTVLPGIKIGSWSVIGAGSVVTKNIPDGVVVAGNPAKILNCINE
ncbi:MAG: acetyltransferase [Flammeovirgaceae bacterium]|nr:MAG: acetyltransferase [Flammeovirgaceae bacterium]